MIKIGKASWMLCICFILFACVHQPIEYQSTGPYYFDSKKTSVTWTAYKYSTKFGVSGILPNVMYNPSTESINELTNMRDIITNFYFECTVDLTPNETASVRDQNIQKYFFDKLSTTKIFGKVIAIDGTPLSGQTSIELTFNGIKKICPAKYLVTGNVIELICTIHLMDFNALDALGILHEAVLDLHKGDDGISITWPDVDIKVVSALGQK